jgi:hypothetical protein
MPLLSEVTYLIVTARSPLERVKKKTQGLLLGRWENFISRMLGKYRWMTHAYM